MSHDVIHDGQAANSLSFQPLAASHWQRATGGEAPNAHFPTADRPCTFGAIRCPSRIRLANLLLLRPTLRTMWRHTMRALLAGMLLVTATACGGRQVNVETGPPAATAVTLRFTNNDNSAVNVYVVN